MRRAPYCARNGGFPTNFISPAGDTAVFTQDRWIDCPEDTPAFSAAFCDILGQQATAPEEAPLPGLTFSVHAPAYAEGSAYS